MKPAISPPANIGKRVYAWPDDIVPAREFLPVIHKLAAHLWVEHANAQNISKAEINGSGWTTDDFDPEGIICEGWRTMIGNAVAAATGRQGHGRDANEIYTRRLYSAAYESYIVSFPVADTMLTALGCIMELDTDIPILPGSSGKVRSWTETWLGYTPKPEECREVMLWVNRYVYSDSPYVEEDAPEVIRKAQIR